MRLPRQIGIPALLLALASAPASVSATAPESATAPDTLDLVQRIDSVLAEPPLDGIHWGVLLVDAATGETLYDRNGHLRFVPASNVKIPVTAAALSRLGPTFRYRTAFYAEAREGGAVGPDGTIPGDLVLAGTGDPTLGEPFHDSAEAALEALVDSLAAAGVRRVEGELVVDAAAWDSTTVPTGWLVGNLDARYAATGGAFGVGSGELELEITGAGVEGAPAHLSWTPVGTRDFVDNRVLTGAPDSEVELVTSYLPESRRWVVEGSVPPGHRETRLRAKRDPVRQGVHALVRIMEERGIRVEGDVRKVWEPGTPVAGGCAAGSLPRCCPGGEPPAPACPSVEVAGMDSPPLTEVVEAIMGPSQNWMAEQLVRTLGAEVGESGSWSAGFEVVTDFLTGELGVDSLDIHFRDGSGLAAYNLLSPRALIRILDDARIRPWAMAFHQSMPEPGRSGTTLAGRLTDLEGRVFAKTGTISHVNALSGYLIADDGRELLFAVLTNTANMPAARVRQGIDDVVRQMARP